MPLCRYSWERGRPVCTQRADRRAKRTGRPQLPGMKNPCPFAFIRGHCSLCFRVSRGPFLVPTSGLRFLIGCGRQSGSETYEKMFLHPKIRTTIWCMKHNGVFGNPARPLS